MLQIEGCVDSRAGNDARIKSKVSCHWQELKHNSSVSQLVVQSLYWPSYPGSSVVTMSKILWKARQRNTKEGPQRLWGICCRLCRRNILILHGVTGQKTIVLLYSANKTSDVILILSLLSHINFQIHVLSSDILTKVTLSHPSYAFYVRNPTSTLRKFVETADSRAHDARCVRWSPCTDCWGSVWGNEIKD
jgi:hypothetical protein